MYIENTKKISKVLSYLILLVLFFIQLPLIGQQVSVNTTVLPPYSAVISDYYTYEGRVIILLQNTTASTVNVKLGGSLTGDNGVMIETDPGAVPPVPIVLGPGENRRLNSSELAELFSEENLLVSGASRTSILRDRLLPEGTYQLCIRAYRYDSPGHTVPLSNEFMGCSNPFLVQYLETPEIIAINSESCGATLSPTSPQNVNVQWTTPAGAPGGTEYVVTIAEIIPDDRRPEDAIRSATSPVFLQRTVFSPMLLLGAADPMFEEGRRYAVRIQARNPVTGSYFRNNGYSPVCWFQYGHGTSGSGISADAVYPSGNDYIPFSYFPLIVKWREFDANVNRFRSSYRLNASGTMVTSHNRDLSWGFGPLESQRRSTGFAEMTREQAQHIAVNRNQTEAPLHNFQRGIPYQWEADITLNKFSSTQDYRASASAGFYYGMSESQPMVPADGAEVSPGEVSLQFKTANAPSRLLPPFAIVQARGRSGPTFFNGIVNEKWALEVSREPEFSTLIDTATGRVGGNFDLQTTNEPAIIADLYKNVTKAFSYSDTGNYYWRIKWLRDPDGMDLSAFYQVSDIYRFHIGEEVTPPADTIPEPRGDCVDGCDAVPIASSERVPSNSFSVNDNVQVGRFTMKITTVTWAGNSARGQGTINIPFFNAPMKVEFSNIQINAAGKVFSGTVTGMVDNSTIIPSGMTGPLASMTGMSNDEADALNTYVSQSTRLVSAFTGSEPVGLPVGLDHVIDGQRYTIAVVGLNFTPQRATLSAIFSIDIPELHGWLSLGASDICFHQDGLAGLGRALLYNPVDRVIPFTDEVDLTFKKSDFPADSGTFVRWDCDGFQELRIKGEFTFPRDWFVPDSVTGDAGSENVKARFTTSIRRKGNWYAALDFDPFQLADLPEWGFRVQDAVFDFSDLGNAEGMRFPVDYRGDRSVRWKGFYLKRLHVKLPEEFKTFDDPTRRLTFAVQDVLIDRTGLSGSLRVENIVRITEGNLDEWAFSIDTVHVDLVSNSFSRGGLNGQVKVPISDDAIGYDMLLRKDTADNFAYEFNIRPTDTISADLWAAELNLLPTSRINITIDSRGFTALADLSGNLGISGDIGGMEGLSFRGIEFEGLVVQSRAPYLSCRSYSFASPQHSAGGFPVSIDNLQLVTREGPGLLETDRSPGPRAGLAFDLSLNITGETNTFHATTRISLLGKLNLGGGEAQAWEFSGLSLDSVAIGGSVGVVEIEGALVFYNSHPTYGEGIRGYIRAAFKPTIEVSATAQFGSVSGYRYWYVDAMAEFNPGLTVFAGLAVNGFGGAAYYHMRMSDPPPFDQIGSASGGGGSGTPGASATQTTYIPDRETLFGFEAKLLLGPPGGGNAYKAQVVFGANFNESSGGIQQMYLNGDLFVMSDGSNPAEAQIYGSLRVNYDFPRNILDGRFELYVNVAGGVVRGIGEGNLAGWMHLYCSPEIWFFKIGEPERRVGIEIAGLFRSESYFMVGMDLPGMPPLPDKVASVLSVRNQRDPRLSSGDGFAFGTWTEFNTGRLGFLIFYARFGLGLGFDLSILNYEGVTCDGMAPGEVIGIDGWYAQGQIYGYFEGDIGIYVDLWFVEGEFKILEIAAAAALQGGFPNPSWMKGNVGGRYRILGGAIKGNCNFEAKVGDECRPPIENPMSDLEIVADLSPANNETNVDCGAEPQALFNIAPDNEFDVTVLTSEGEERVRTFRVKHRNLQLMQNEARITGRQVSSMDSALLTLTPDDYLDPFTWYNISISAYIDEYIDGRWDISKRLDGTEISKTYEHRFKTGAYPDMIRARDVLYSYPFHNQRFFLQDECRTALLKLKSGMSRLFNQEQTATNREWKYYAEFFPVDQSAFENSEGRIKQELTVNGSFITFPIPSLLNNTVYAVRLLAVNEVVRTLETIGQEILSHETQRLVDANQSVIQDLQTRRYILDNVVQVKTGRIDATQVRANEKLLYVWYFRTSQYNSLRAKIDGLTAPSSEYSNLGDFEYFDVSYSTREQFDVFDADGFRYERYGRSYRVSPLVDMTAKWDARWHRNFADRYVYDLLSDMRREGLTRHYYSRNYRLTGIPPLRTVDFSRSYYPKNPLRESEYMPLPPSSPSTGSVSRSGVSRFDLSPSTVSFGSGMVMASRQTAITSIVPRLELSYEAGIFVPLDFYRVKNIAGRVVAVYGLWGSEFMPTYLRYRISRVLYSPYSRMYRGQYGINFNYNNPSQCVDPDDFSGGESATKYFTY